MHCKKLLTENEQKSNCASISAEKNLEDKCRKYKVGVLLLKIFPVIIIFVYARGALRKETFLMADSKQV